MFEHDLLTGQKYILYFIVSICSGTVSE